MSLELDATHTLLCRQARIQRKLARHRKRYDDVKQLSEPVWIPFGKMPRLLTTSASAMRRLLRKAELLGVTSQVESGAVLRKLGNDERPRYVRKERFD